MSHLCSTTNSCLLIFQWCVSPFIEERREDLFLHPFLNVFGERGRGHFVFACACMFCVFVFLFCNHELLLLFLFLALFFASSLFCNDCFLSMIICQKFKKTLYITN